MVSAYSRSLMLLNSLSEQKISIKDNIRLQYFSLFNEIMYLLSTLLYRELPLSPTIFRFPGEFEITLDYCICLTIKQQVQVFYEQICNEVQAELTICHRKRRRLSMILVCACGGYKVL